VGSDIVAQAQLKLEEGEDHVDAKEIFRKIAFCPSIPSKPRARRPCHPEQRRIEGSTTRRRETCLHLTQQPTLTKSQADWRYRSTTYG
jgi:hypothetical protein